jgi:hypothetical protein
MPITFNTNNNYSVDIVTEPDVLNPTVIRYSSDTNTPFVEMKITADIYQYPLLAGNLNFDGLPRVLKHEPSLNVNISCTPASSPHGINSSSTYEEIITSGNVYITGASCSNSGTNMVTTSSQGPFQSERNGAPIYGDLVSNGVAWTKVVWIEVYEADDGTLVNDQISPEAYEDLQLWNTWGMYPLITNNVNPLYIRAFVFLEYGPLGPSALANNVTIQIDIDEDTPIYGCMDPTAPNYDSSVTIDDGSCTVPPPPPTFTLPPFTFTFGPHGTLLTGQYANIITTNISYGGYGWAMMMIQLDVQPAINALPNSSGVNYQITDLYYIDVAGNQTNLNYIPLGGLMSPPYNLVSNGYFYLFQNGITNMSLYTTPVDITTSVLFGTPVNIDGVVFLNPPTGINGTGWPIDLTCTVTATDSGAITATHTEILSVTV